MQPHIYACKERSGVWEDLNGNDEEEEHVGQDMGEALV